MSIVGVVSVKDFFQFILEVDGPCWEIVVRGDNIAGESALENFSHKVSFLWEKLEVTSNCHMWACGSVLPLFFLILGCLKLIGGTVAKMAAESG